MKKHNPFGPTIQGQTLFERIKSKKDQQKHSIKSINPEGLSFIDLTGLPKISANMSSSTSIVNSNLVPPIGINHSFNQSAPSVYEVPSFGPNDSVTISTDSLTTMNNICAKSMFGDITIHPENFSIDTNIKLVNDILAHLTKTADVKDDRHDCLVDNQHKIVELAALAATLRDKIADILAKSDAKFSDEEVSRVISNLFSMG